MPDLIRVLLLAAGLALPGATLVAGAASASLQAATTAADNARTIDHASFEAYLDGLVAAQFRDHQLAGMTFALIHDNRLRLLKGYGFADLEQQIPVDPKVHLFRPGSVSKLVTWTAVMQLVEQGKLDLQTDIATYVPQFEIPNEFDTPLTLTHLLTHSPGLEDGAAGYLFGDEPSDLIGLAESLERWRPNQVNPPGEYSAYSNWGTALAGLIVANVSGESFEDYVRKHVFEPLSMQQATFDEPLPEGLKDDMAVGYLVEDGALAPFVFEYVKNFGPAGALSASSAAMVNFMFAHLNGGRFGDAQVLQPATVAQMHQPLFSHHVAVSAMAHGFIEYQRNGQRFVGHGGDTIVFHSQLLLDPTSGFGFFVSFNSDEGAQARAAIVDGVIDYFYPPAPRRVTGPELEGSAERIAKVVGGYRLNRRSHTKLEGVLGLAGDVPISSPAPGRITLSGSRLEGQFVEIEPYVFAQLNRQERLVFDVDDAGEVQRMFFGSAPIVIGEKVTPLTAASNHQLILVLAVLAALFVVINTVRNRAQALTGPALWGRRSLTWAAGLILAGTVGFVVALANLDMSRAVFDFPPAGAPLALGLWLLSAVCTAAALVLLVPVWRAPQCGLWARLRYTYVLLTFVGFVAVLHYWNMLGWKY